MKPNRHPTCIWATPGERGSWRMRNFASAVSAKRCSTHRRKWIQSSKTRVTCRRVQRNDWWLRRYQAPDFHKHAALCQAVTPGAERVAVHPSGALERFRFTCCHLKIMRGGIFLGKMPLGLKLSAKSRIETAVKPRGVTHNAPVQAVTSALIWRPAPAVLLRW